jgi:toxin HigB-1
MIRSFADKESELVWQGQRSRRLPKHVQEAGLRKLRILNRAASLEDLRLPPGNQLERLERDCKGQWSIRINGQWRICFTWHEGEARNVEIVDYH